MSKSSLITELNLEHRHMLELVQGFGKNDFDQAGASGEWTAKDVFGHLAYWNGEAAEAISLALRGERPAPWLDGVIDEINQREVASRRELSLYEVMDEFRISLRAVTTVLERATDNQLERELEFKSEDGQTANGAWVAQALIQHYRSHREALQAWLTRN
jgi:hypothetical protein